MEEGFGGGGRGGGGVSIFTNPVRNLRRVGDSIYVMLTLTPTSHNTASERRSTQCCLHCGYEPQTSASNYVASQAPFINFTNRSRGRVWAPFDLATWDVPNLGPDAPVHVKYLSSIQRQKGSNWLMF